MPCRTSANILVHLVIQLAPRATEQDCINTAAHCRCPAVTLNRFLVTPIEGTNHGVRSSQYFDKFSTA
jgi:hypothetical protein